MPEQPPLPRPRPCCSSSCPRFNRRFGVPAQCPEPAFRPMDPESLPGADPVFQASQESGAGQHREVLQAHPATAAQPATPQLRRSVRRGAGRDWMAGCRYNMRDASLRPRKRLPVHHISEAATGLLHLPPSRSPIPNPRQNLRLQISICWAQSQIRKKVPTPRQSTKRR